MTFHYCGVTAAKPPCSYQQERKLVMLWLTKQLWLGQCWERTASKGIKYCKYQEWNNSTTLWFPWSASSLCGSKGTGCGQAKSEGRASFLSRFSPVLFHMADAKNSPCCPPNSNEGQKAVQKRRGGGGLQDLRRSLMNTLLVCRQHSLLSSSCLQLFKLFPQGNAIWWQA